MAQNTPMTEPLGEMRPEKQDFGALSPFKSTVVESPGADVVVFNPERPSPFEASHIEQEIPQSLRGASAGVVPSVPHQRRMSLFEPFSLPPSRVSLIVVIIALFLFRHLFPCQLWLLQKPHDLFLLFVYASANPHLHGGGVSVFRVERTLHRLIK